MRLYINNKTVIETSQGIDLSLELSNKSHNPRAWYVDLPRFEPVRANGFVGSVLEGGAVNFRDIYFNPHGHGTHTECVGHISKEPYSINTYLKEFWFSAKLISVTPEAIINPTDGETDYIVTLAQIKALGEIKSPALILRTLPNSEDKKTMVYSGTNPPYFEASIADYLVEQGVEHLLVDLPSVDREIDGGALDFHHRFWCYPTSPRLSATITELIFVPDNLEDGEYMLNLHVAAFENDASPSRPVLYKLQQC